VYTFCLLFSYLIKVVVLLIFICCYQHVLVNKDIQKRKRIEVGARSTHTATGSHGVTCHPASPAITPAVVVTQIIHQLRMKG